MLVTSNNIDAPKWNSIFTLLSFVRAQNIFKQPLLEDLTFDNGSYRWRICFWVSTIPAALLAIFMEFSTESPHWLFKVLLTFHPSFGLLSLLCYFITAQNTCFYCKFVMLLHKVRPA